MRRALFPGSFNPFTIGHLDIVHRGLDLFDEVIIAVGTNQDKPAADYEARLAQINTSITHDRVRVTCYTGLTADYCKEVDAQFILRGLRNAQDMEYEYAIAEANRHLTGIETVCLLAKGEHRFLSSSIVRDIDRNGGDTSNLLP